MNLGFLFIILLILSLRLKPFNNALRISPSEMVPINLFFFDYKAYLKSCFIKIFNYILQRVPFMNNCALPVFIKKFSLLISF